MTKRTGMSILLLSFLAAAAFARDFYWESPQPLPGSDTRFPASATNGTASVVLWQEIAKDSESSGNIWLSCRVYDGVAWTERDRFAGPFAYSGEVPSIASVTLDAANRIIVAAATGIRNISVFVSSDLGATFSETRLGGESSAVLAPQVFVRADGGYLLFATRGGTENFTLVYSRSPDGVSWSPFVPFAPASGLLRAFLPAHAVVGGADVVVFQAFHEEPNRSSNQLYSTVSTNSGASWSEPALITDFADSGAAGSAAARFGNYHNQRARLLAAGSSAYLVWERARVGAEKYRIYCMTIGPQGTRTGAAEAVSSPDGYCFDPDVVFVDGKPAIVWFDNRRGVNRIYLASKEGYVWSETELSKNSLDAMFGRIIPIRGSIEVYWQQTQARGGPRVTRLAPDRSVSLPAIRPSGFTAGGRGRSSLVRATVRMPEDSSGIAGYSWAWGSGAKPQVPADIMRLPEENSLSLEADADGTWTLGVRVADYAGNWSPPAYVEYTRDTVPPPSPVILPPALDANGFLPSNTGTLSWERGAGEDVAGYTWKWEYVAPPDALARFGAPAPADERFQETAASFMPVKAPPAALMGGDTSFSFTNADNGMYALSVAAIDGVGNIGKASVRYFALDKYVPYTYITYIDSSVDKAGSVSLSIVGRGFADGGLVSAVYLDRDGKAPWDVTLSRSRGQFLVRGDRLVSGISLSDLEEGTYRIGLDHPVRGLYLSKPILSVAASGTVKFGDYRGEFVPPWKTAVPSAKFALRTDALLFGSALLFAFAVFAFSLAGIAGTARESIQIRREVQALISGDSMPSEKKKRSVTLHRRGLGLRFKLSFFTASLVISVVLIVSIPLGVRFSANQERTLAKGLEDRVSVLLDSLVSGARAYLPSQNLLELGFLPAQMSALDEARSATITGKGLAGAATGVDFVWATNDPEIAKKIDTPRLESGRSRIVSDESAEIDKRIVALDAEAARSVNELSAGIASLTQEATKLALKTDAGSVRRLGEIQTITRQLEEKLNAELSRIGSGGAGSYPEYNPQQLSRAITRYIFYKPVLYRQANDTKYVHGTVRVTVSTESLLQAVASDRAALVSMTVGTAIIAVIIGILGALVLASIIISPIRKLAAHVAMIRDTEDKEKLEGKDLLLKSRDEIGLLGETINDMTHGLAKAAAASKDLTVGKEVQKMFIPLETDSAGRKLTCGSSRDDHAEFFGYYEGAKGVSGDYFDYIKLDDRHYAIIKCDVAGKGVPAALIMVEVATLFLDYFKDWKFEKNGTRLDVFVSRINDLIESRGFKGRFAAFTLCLFDSVSGDVHFCNAGDNLVHVYSAAERKMKLVQLPETSAAGVFPTFMVDMKGGFRVVKQHLASGDVLFLYTDGIEEAKRLFRDSGLRVHECAEPGLAKEAAHGSHSVGQDNEELGPERVNEIIEAVFARKPWSLKKWHNPVENEPFDFDFTNCEGTIEDAILALVSVEKVFRMYRDPSATDFNRVQVDRKVDSFLNRHFRQYGLYCGSRRDHPEHPEYLYYTNVREDAQYDDLTILGIRKR